MQNSGSQHEINIPCWYKRLKEDIPCVPHRSLSPLIQLSVKPGHPLLACRLLVVTLI